MSIGLAIVRGAQRLLGDGPVARFLARLGVARLVRWPHERRVLASGSYESTLLGKSARFQVTSRVQLEHIDAMWREEEMLRRLVGALREGDVFYDIGANIGLMSIAVALNAGDKGLSLHAFEPEPKNAQALRANLALNDLSSVRVHELALGDRKGAVTLYLDSHVGAGSHSLIPRRGLRSEATVALERADDLAGTLGAPRVVKIDVEGAEFAVLRGMEEQLRRHAVRDLFLELHPKALAASGADEHALRRGLEEPGYTAAWRHRRGDEWHEHYRSGA